MQTEKVCMSNSEMYSKSILWRLYVIIVLPLKATRRYQLTSTFLLRNVQVFLWIILGVFQMRCSSDFQRFCRILVHSAESLEG
jgi:hypothetical protein